MEAHRVCPECGYHHPMTAYERLELLVDEGSFDEHDAGLYSTNPLDFPNYEEQLARDYAKTGLKSEILTGEAKNRRDSLSQLRSVIFGVRGGTMGGGCRRKKSLVILNMPRRTDCR